MYRKGGNVAKDAVTKFTQELHGVQLGMTARPDSPENSAYYTHRRKILE